MGVLATGSAHARGAPSILIEDNSKKIQVSHSEQKIVEDIKTLTWVGMDLVHLCVHSCCFYIPNCEKWIKSVRAYVDIV